MDELLPDDSLTSTVSLADDSAYEIVSLSGSYTPDEPIESTQTASRDVGLFAGVDASIGLYLGGFLMLILLACIIYFIFRYFRSSKR